MLRTCTQCGIEQEITAFVRQKGKYRADPYRKDCKNCKNKIRREKNATLGKVPYRWPKGYSFFKGKRHSEESKIKMGESKKGTPCWNKGKLNSLKRFSRLYKIWRDAVKDRDGYKCTMCKSQTRLHAHHVISWKENEELRFDVNNGQTICQPCHARIEGFQKGHKQSEEARKKMSEKSKGRIPWNKGLKSHASAT